MFPFQEKPSQLAAPEDNAVPAVWAKPGPEQYCQFQGLLLPLNATPVVPGPPPDPQTPVPLFQGLLLPPRQFWKGRGLFSPVHTDICSIRQIKTPNCVFCLASLHLISMLSPVLLNSPLRAFFLFSPCQLLLFDLQKQMRNPGESPRPSGMTEFSSAPPTPCHSPRASLSSPSRAAPGCIAGPGDTRALLPQCPPGHCALPPGQPEYTPQCVWAALCSSLSQPHVMGEFVSQSRLDFP